MATGIFNDALQYLLSGNEAFRAKLPKAYGFLGGFLGTRPDEFDGSVLDPLSAEVAKGAEPGFWLGTATGIAPLAGGIAAAKGTVAGTKAAQGGMLRLGGREDLIASHGTTLNALLGKTGQLPPELTHVSLAVQKDRLKNPFALEDKFPVTFIPRAGKFDPATSPSALHSRDAWTPAYGDSVQADLLRRARQTGKAPTKRELAQARAEDRFLSRWTKGGEGATVDMDLDTTVLGNERFRSFKAFEKSKAADALEVMAPGWGNAAEAERLQDYLARVAIELEMPATDVLAKIKANVPKDGSPYVINGINIREALRQAKASPRGYAELKNYGQTPLTGDTWAGALYRPIDPAFAQHFSPGVIDAQNKLLVQLRNRGITPVPQSWDSLQNLQLANELQKQAR